MWLCTSNAALGQLVVAKPDIANLDEGDPFFELACFYGSFLASDGTESALARLTVAATNATMDCYARANADESAIRDAELSYAVKLSMTVAALSRALDSHRSHDRQVFIDDTLLPSPSETESEETDEEEDKRPLVVCSALRFPASSKSSDRRWWAAHWAK